MPIENGDWSLEGTGPGEADSWTVTGVPKGQFAAEYTETDPPLGDALVTTCFETWSVDDWVSDMTLIEVAEYTQNLHEDPDDRVEDFEGEWPAGAQFLDDLVNIEAAEYVDEVNGGTQPVDDFERIPETIFATTGALYIDEVNGGTQAWEDFERVADTGILPATAAIFEGASLWESFDITTFWTNVDDQMKTI